MELLTIGSVVKVKGSIVQRMITGYLRAATDGRVFDYASVPYPVGMGDSASLLVFNADAVEEVLFEGYKDENYPQLKALFEYAVPIAQEKAKENVSLSLE